MKANNKYLENYDDTKESNYIVYLDANNLYGTSMSDSLPYGRIRFIEVGDEAERRLLNTLDRSEVGHIPEVGLTFPVDIHERLKELPLAPENLTPDIEWLSDLQKDVGVVTGEPRHR